MSREETEVTVGLGPDLADWLDDAADGRDRDAVLRDLLVAYRSAAADGADVPDPADLADRLNEQREEYRDLVEDVRDRVIQVKRETDRKAPADHDHPELAEAVAATEARLSEVESELGAIRSSVEDVESGFDNYEDVLEYLVDAADDVEGDLDVLANAVLDLRETTREVATRAGARSEAARLKRAANQLGITAADCEDCGNGVDVALLSGPECPHCRATFADVEAGSGFFSSNTLVTGDPPAIEGGVGTDDGPLAEVAGNDRDAPATTLTDSGGESG
jgi:predicted Zn-ribbon and HTH transcriptional regulator